MNIDLNKNDLIALVKVTTPYYSVFDNFLVKKCGYYTGGFHDKWDWKNSELENLSNEDLFKLYNTCKNSWK